MGLLIGEEDAGARGAGPLSPAFERTYDELLQELAEHSDELPDLVCLHWPMHEPSYTGQLLVIRRNAYRALLTRRRDATILFAP